MHRLHQIHRGPDFGPHWQQKIRTLFHRLDANKDGKMSVEDFNLIAERFIEVGELTDEHAQEVRDYYTHEIWLKYFKESEAEHATLDSFVNNLKTMGKKNILATTNDIHNRYFTNIDRDCDGLASLEDFTKYFYILGVKEEFAKEAFDAIDVNHDGRISRGEFMTAGNDFYGGDAVNKTSDLFCGPLVA